MSDVHIVDALIAETRRHLLALLLNVQHQGQEALDVGCGDIVAIRALDERFALEIENRDETGHGRCGRRRRELTDGAQPFPLLC